MKLALYRCSLGANRLRNREKAHHSRQGGHRHTATVAHRIGVLVRRLYSRLERAITPRRDKPSVGHRLRLLEEGALDGVSMMTDADRDACAVLAGALSELDGILLMHSLLARYAVTTSASW